MRTIVHAGFHKTGTTSLQGFLADGAAGLAGQGVDYPAGGRAGHPGHHGLACAFATARASRGPNDLFLPERERFRRGFRPDQLATDWLAGHPPDAQLRVLSSEIISTYDGAELARLIDVLGATPRFVLYYRGGIGFLYSCWATKVRWGHAGSFREFAQATLALDPRTPIAGMLAFAAQVAELAGVQQLQLRSYEAATKHAHGIAGDFVECVLGLDASRIQAGERRNVSPSPLVIELVRAMTCTIGDESAGVHAALKAVLARDTRAPGLVDALCAAIAPRMRPLTLRELDPAGQALDEHGRPRAAPQDRFPGWTFAPAQAWSYAETDDVLGAVGPRPEFAELLSLVTRRPGTPPTPA